MNGNKIRQITTEEQMKEALESVERYLRNQNLSEIGMQILAIRLKGK